MIDKNKLKEKIQKTPSKDILYVYIAPLDKKLSIDTDKKIKKFIGNENSEIFVIRKKEN
jgi:hypothetical protein